MFLTASKDGTVKVWETETGIELFQYKKHKRAVRHASFSPDAKFVVSVSEDYTLQVWNWQSGKLLFECFDDQGKYFKKAIFSQDGNYLIALSSGGSIVLFDASNGKKLIERFLLQNNEFIDVTPNSLFDATPGAMKMMYYVVNNPSDTANPWKIVEFEQLKDRYYEPGLWAKVMGTNTEPLRNTRGMNDLKMYPEVFLTDKGNGKIGVLVKNQGGGIGRVMVYINGKEISSDIRGEKPDTAAKVMRLEVDIKNHPYLRANAANTISAKAYNAEGYLVSRETTLTINSDNSQLSTLIPQLFAVCIGVSDYTGDQIDLTFAAKDAEDIATALELGAKRLFGADKSYIYRLTTEQTNKQLKPTRENIKQKFAEIAKKSTSADILVVYLAGHGINWGGQDGDFYYLTQDAYTASPSAYNDPAIRNTTTLSSAELTELIKSVLALKQVLIIDACASGKVVDNLMLANRDISSSTLRALDRMKDRTGMHIITGCTADAVSYEASKFGQGLLTYSLLEGIKGAALREERFVDVSQLFQHSRDRVPVLATGVGGIQQPQVFSPYGAASFDIGELTTEDKTKVPMAKEKPMFLLSSFQDSETLDDVLGIEKLVDEAFRELNGRGATAPIIFVEAKEFPEAYRIRGQYTSNGNKINLKVNIFKGKEKVNSFDLIGEKGKINELVENIVKKATTIEQQK